MNKYFIKAILLKNCRYSVAAYDLIKMHKLPTQIIWVDQENKDNYKTNIINTFPQIYLKKNNTKGNLLLGGYSDLSDTISIFLHQKLSNKDIAKFMEKYKWSKKATLRLIQLINKINSI